MGELASRTAGCHRSARCRAADWLGPITARPAHQLGQAPFSTAELPSSAAKAVPISSCGVVSGRRSSRVPSGNVTDLIDPTWTHSPVGSQTRPRLWAAAVGAMASATTMPAAVARREIRRFIGLPFRCRMSRRRVCVRFVEPTGTSIGRQPCLLANARDAGIRGVARIPAAGAVKSGPLAAVPTNQSGQLVDVDRLREVAGEACVEEPFIAGIEAQSSHRDDGYPRCPGSARRIRTASVPSKSGRRRSIRMTSGTC